MEKARPTPGSVICARVALAQAGGAITLDFAHGADRFSLVLVEADGGPRAFVNSCPHARWPLETFDGRLLRGPGGALICAAHGALFAAEDGKCLGGPAGGRSLEPFAIEERDGQILAA
jgi:nitrite reductase/ring-hydroxylating ferredoxin subunit